VLRPHEFHVARRLRRTLVRSGFEVSFNQSFSEVIATCAEDRAGQQGTWITPDMSNAYIRLHRQGWAHSVEIWHAGDLAGGLYGLSIGSGFFGESMFSRRSNASKAAMLALCHHLVASDFEIFDCQVESPHLVSLGATLIPRPRFASILNRACESNAKFSDWPAERRPIADFLP
jgi:leucyl/phenylalanyl-tRNA--protein transferase